MMGLQILYRERKVANDTGDEYADMVFVELRKWSAGDDHPAHRYDVIMDCLVVVDSEEVVNTSEVLRTKHGNRLDDAQAIRAAIAKFDAMLSSHPSKVDMQ